MKEVLLYLGLSQSEISLYTALLELGNAPVQSIQERTGIERRYLYDVLGKLIEKGVVSYMIEQGKKTFTAAHPKKIQDLLEEKKKEIELINKEFSSLMPGLIAQYDQKRPDITVEVFRGIEGTKTIGEEMLQYNDNYFIGGNGSVEKYMPYYWAQFNKKRVARKVMWHDLIIKDTKIKGLKKHEYYEYRVLPKEVSSPHVISIYGQKVVLTLWQNQPFNIVIESEEIANSYLKYFKYLWRIAT